MKKLLLFLALLSPACHPVFAGSISDATREKVLHAVAVLQEDNKIVRHKLLEVQADLTASETETKVIQAKADKLQAERDWYRADDAKKDSVIAERDREISKKNRKLDELGWMLAITAALVVFLWSGQLVPYVGLALAPYALGGRLGLSLTTFGVVFAWVRYF
jgi:cation transport ATPase